MSEKTFRLVTRSDFDGLVCALLLQEMTSKILAIVDSFMD